jgi:hypothetical protein
MTNLERYQATIIAKHGSLPSIATLAAHETREMRARSGNATMDNAAQGKANARPREVSTNRAERKTEILRHLPNNSRTIAELSGMSEGWVAELLSEMKRDGSVNYRRTGNFTSWYQEATE